MKNNNEVQGVNQETKTQDGVENANYKEVELKPVSFDDMPEEERNAMILKFCQDKIDNEILPKYTDREITPEVIEEVKIDVSRVFNGLKCDVKQNGDNLEIEFIE